MLLFIILFSPICCLFPFQSEFGQSSDVQTIQQKMIELYSQQNHQLNQYLNNLAINLNISQTQLIEEVLRHRNELIRILNQIGTNKVQIRMNQPSTQTYYFFIKSIENEQIKQSELNSISSSKQQTESRNIFNQVIIIISLIVLVCVLLFYLNRRFIKHMNQQPTMDGQTCYSQELNVKYMLMNPQKQLQL